MATGLYIYVFGCMLGGYAYCPARPLCDHLLVFTDANLMVNHGDDLIAMASYMAPTPLLLFLLAIHSLTCRV